MYSTLGTAIKKWTSYFKANNQQMKRNKHFILVEHPNKDMFKFAQAIIE
jgi:hypothetical protein